MSEDKTGGPAFPQTKIVASGEGFYEGPINYGMTLLDWFAGQAIDKVVYRWKDSETTSAEERPFPKDLAKACYDYAEAMIAERKRRGEKNP